MNERRLGRLLRGLVLISSPLMGMGMGCGGSAAVDGEPGSSACKGSFSSSGPCDNQTFTLPSTCFAEHAVVGISLPEPECQARCGDARAHGCVVTASESASATLACWSCIAGRRPAGLAGSVIDGPCESGALGESGELGDYFAQAAHLEAASVAAFRIMRDELRALGAPKRLLRAAGRAARDEVRHARTTSALARRFGGRLRPLSVARMAPRPIEVMAIENAVEGCVRETYGALLATRQAQAARDPQVRGAMMRIARDETRHAALSWSVGRWLESRLDGAAKRRVESAKQAAVRELVSAVESEAAPSFAEVVGLPSRAEATALAAQLQRALWDSAGEDRASA